MHAPDTADRYPASVFLIFLKLGLTSFGGPIAHLAYFREEFVARRRWLSEERYAELVALCQFLPGPASSQVGMALGLMRAGYAGALAAWVGFTLPSALALTLLALGIAQQGDRLPGGLLHGLKIIALAVIAQALWGMARSLCPDRARVTLMAASAYAALTVPATTMQLAVVAVAGMFGALVFKPAASASPATLHIGVSTRAALAALGAFATLLIGLPWLSATWPDPVLTMVDAFYRAGALVFGGGHVVLPLLQAELVPPGGISDEVFLAGYGATQAMPGPLFTFAAFLGASLQTGPGGALGAMLALLAIFLPSFLLVVGALPFWARLRMNPRAQAALAGVNASVVGLLLAVLYTPAWTSAIQQPADFALAVVALIALVFWKLPPWSVVLGCAAIGWAMSL